jgi:hypothetical protein
MKEQMELTVSELERTHTHTLSLFECRHGRNISSRTIFVWDLFLGTIIYSRSEEFEDIVPVALVMCECVPSTSFGNCDNSLKRLGRGWVVVHCRRAVVVVVVVAVVRLFCLVVVRLLSLQLDRLD